MGLSVHRTIINRDPDMANGPSRYAEATVITSKVYPIQSHQETRNLTHFVMNSTVHLALNDLRSSLHEIHESDHTSTVAMTELRRIVDAVSISALNLSFVSGRKRRQ